MTEKLIFFRVYPSQQFRLSEMSEDSLPFDEKFCPSIAKFSNGEKRKQEWEKSIKNPQEYWVEKAKAIDWFKPFSKVLDDSNPPFYKWFPD